MTNDLEAYWGFSGLLSPFADQLKSLRVVYMYNAIVREHTL
jgi:hypothetical protein